MGLVETITAVSMETISDLHAEILAFVLTIIVYKVLSSHSVAVRRSTKEAHAQSCERPSASKANLRLHARQEVGRSGNAKSNSHSAANDLLAKCQLAIGTGDLESSLKKLRQLDEANACGSGAPVCLWRQFLEMAVRHQDTDSVDVALRRLQKAGAMDKMRYNLAIKASLVSKRYDLACSLLSDMCNEGFTPSVTTINAIIAQFVDHGNAQYRQRVWRIIDVMKRQNVTPNHITGSVVLKTLGANSSQADIERVMKIVADVGEQADEALQSSVLEAYVRIGQPTLVADALARLRHQGGFAPKASSTFGSLIKAHSFVGDMEGVWNWWRQLRSGKIPLSSIAIGCMVEAVVSNGDVEGGRELVTRLQAEEGSKEHLNAIIYGSVLKGCGRTRRLKLMWTVFKEMLDHNIKPSQATVNTMIDACARNGEMDKVPELLETMKRFGLTADLITYSTVIKGHCQRGHVDRAFAVFAELKATGLRCDQVVYNTLIDGCASAGRTNDGLRMLEEMKQAGIQVNNYVIVRMLRLFGKERRVDEAFDLVLCAHREHIKPTAAVFASLVQICVASKDVPRALEAYKLAQSQAIQFDCRTQQLFITTMLESRQQTCCTSFLEGLLREVLGLPPPQGAHTSSRRGEDRALGVSAPKPFLVRVLGILRRPWAAEWQRELATRLEAEVREHRPDILFN